MKNIFLYLFVLIAMLSSNAFADPGPATAANVGYGFDGWWYDTTPYPNGYTQQRQGVDVKYYELSATNHGVFITWNTYSADGTKMAWFVSQGALDQVNRKASNIPIYISPYGKFNAGTPPYDLEVVGSLTMTLEDCNHSRLEWNITRNLPNGVPAGSGSMELMRLSPGTSIGGRSLCTTPLSQFHPQPTYPAPTYPYPTYPYPTYPYPTYPYPTYPYPTYPYPTYPQPTYPYPTYPGPDYPSPTYPYPTYPITPDYPPTYPPTYPPDYPPTYPPTYPPDYPPDYPPSYPPDYPEGGRPAKAGNPRANNLSAQDHAKLSKFVKSFQMNITGKAGATTVMKDAAAPAVPKDLGPATVQNVGYGFDGWWYDTVPYPNGYTQQRQGVDVKYYELGDSNHGVFITWNTYSADGTKMAWFVSQGALDQVNMRAANIPIYIAPYGKFNAGTPPNELETVGSLTMTLEDCNHARLQWTITRNLPNGVPAGSGSMELSRLSPVTSVNGYDLCTTPLSQFGAL